MSRPPASCHPNRPHTARGLCATCYQAAWKAGTLPQRPKPTPAPHSCARGHAPSRTCYVNCKCRCGQCRAEVSAYARKRSRAQAYGTWDPDMVDAEPVRAHVRSLMAKRIGATNGVGLKQIVKVSGVAQGTLWKLMYGDPNRGGPSKTVRRHTADRLLAVTPKDAADGASCPVGPTRRKLDAMIEGGFCKAELGRYITGNPAADSLQVAQSPRGRVSLRTARTVDRLYADWKAGQIVPRGRRSRYEQGPPSPFPATPTPGLAPRPEDVQGSCIGCGGQPMPGGATHCLGCFRALSRKAA